MTSKSYVVRDVGARPAPGASYPYTLRGLEDALEHAAFRSAFSGQAQEVVVVGDGEDRVIRRYEDGHEADRPPGTSRTAHPPGTHPAAPPMAGVLAGPGRGQTPPGSVIRTVRTSNGLPPAHAPDRRTPVTIPSALGSPSSIRDPRGSGSTPSTHRSSPPASSTTRVQGGI